MLLAIAGSNASPWRAGRHGSGRAVPPAVAASGFSGTMPIAILSQRHAPIL